jgi:hypothetical protein
MKKLKFTTKPAIALYAMLVAVFLVGCDMPTQYVQIAKNKPYLIVEGGRTFK